MRTIDDCNESTLDMRNYILFASWIDLDKKDMVNVIKEISNVLTRTCADFCTFIEYDYMMKNRYIGFSKMAEEAEKFSGDDDVLMSFDVYGIYNGSGKKTRRNITKAITKTIQNNSSLSYSFENDGKLYTHSQIWELCNEQLKKPFFFVGVPEGVDLNVEIMIRSYDFTDKLSVEISVCILGYTVEYNGERICKLYKKVVDDFVTNDVATPYYASISYDAIPCVHRNYHYNRIGNDGSDDEKRYYQFATYDWSMLIDMEKLEIVKSNISNYFDEGEIDVECVGNMAWITLSKSIEDVDFNDKKKLKLLYGQWLYQGYLCTNLSSVRKYGELIYEDSTGVLLCLNNDGRRKKKNVSAVLLDDVYIVFYHGTDMLPKQCLYGMQML